jgi:hypothetical protein
MNGPRTRCSSRRGHAHGQNLPSEIYSSYAFATRLTAASRTLPKVLPSQACIEAIEQLVTLL